MKKSLTLTMVIAAGLAVVLLLYLFIFQVRESEVAIVTTFGKPSKAIAAPGKYFQWPWPIQKAEIYDTRLRVFEDTEYETVTRDKKNIMFVTSVGWKISSEGDKPLVYRRQVVTADRAMKMLSSLVKDRKTDVVGRYDLSNFVSIDPNQMKFDQIEEAMRAAVAEKAKDQFGIDVVMLHIKRLKLPESAATKVQERFVAERQTEVAKFRAEGDSMATQIRADAELQKQQLESAAKREAMRIRGEGEARAVEYYGIFAQYPDLAKWLSSIRGLEEVTKTKTTIVLDPTESLVKAIMYDAILPGEKTPAPLMPPVPLAPATLTPPTTVAPAIPPASGQKGG
jgi:modulator of FtsH protease HflC